MNPGDEIHAVRCCNDDLTTCTTPLPCTVKGTYLEAVEVCSRRGLRLCPRAENLPDICCGKGCNVDTTTMWIGDDRVGKEHTCIHVNQKKERTMVYFDANYCLFQKAIQKLTAYIALRKLIHPTQHMTRPLTRAGSLLIAEQCLIKIVITIITTSAPIQTL